MIGGEIIDLGGGGVSVSYCVSSDGGGGWGVCIRAIHTSGARLSNQFISYIQNVQLMILKKCYLKYSMTFYVFL